MTGALDFAFLGIFVLIHCFIVFSYSRLVGILEELRWIRAALEASDHFRDAAKKVVDMNISNDGGRKTATFTMKGEDSGK